MFVHQKTEYMLGSYAIPDLEYCTVDVCDDMLHVNVRRMLVSTMSLQ